MSQKQVGQLQLAQCVFHNNKQWENKLNADIFWAHLMSQFVDFNKNPIRWPIDLTLCHQGGILRTHSLANCLFLQIGCFISVLNVFDFSNILIKKRFNGGVPIFAPQKAVPPEKLLLNALWFYRDIRVLNKKKHLQNFRKKKSSLHKIPHKQFNNIH